MPTIDKADASLDRRGEFNPRDVALRIVSTADHATAGEPSKNLRPNCFAQNDLLKTLISLLSENYRAWKISNRNWDGFFKGKVIEDEKLLCGNETAPSILKSSFRLT